MNHKLEDIWIKIKTFLHLPLPIRNCYYKGHRISTKRNWFCKNCAAVFHLNPKENIKLDEIKCPDCGSHSAVWGTWIFKAVVNKIPPQEILELLKETDYKKLLIQLIKDEKNHEGIFRKQHK